ncbi:MAG TPA: hypothetical protein VFZ00_17585, partial [Solirubrobacter sp.]|nr:hypothetical protein [Solirubrobacter sp.]
MLPFRLRKGATIVITTASALAAVGVASAASGAISGAGDGSDVIHACKRNSSGKIRVIDPTQPGRAGRCKHGE